MWTSTRTTRFSRALRRLAATDRITAQSPSCRGCLPPSIELPATRTANSSGDASSSGSQTASPSGASVFPRRDRLLRGGLGTPRPGCARRCRSTAALHRLDPQTIRPGVEADLEGRAGLTRARSKPTAEQVRKLIARAPAGRATLQYSFANRNCQIAPSGRRTSVSPSGTATPVRGGSLTIGIALVPDDLAHEPFD